MNYEMVQINFQLCFFNFTQFVSHGLTCSELCCAHMKKAYILEAMRTWYIQHEFSDCRCDIVCIWYNDKFLKKGAAKFKSKKFSEFGSQTVTRNFTETLKT